MIMSMSAGFKPNFGSCSWIASPGSCFEPAWCHLLARSVSHMPVSTSTFFSPPVTSQHSDGVMTLTPSIRQLVRRFWKLPIQPVLIA